MADRAIDHSLVIILRTLNDKPSDSRPEIDPTCIRLMKLSPLICRLQRIKKANGPRRSATSALKTTAVNVKSANAERILRGVGNGVYLVSRRKNVATLTKQKISYV